MLFLSDYLKNFRITVAYNLHSCCWTVVTHSFNLSTGEKRQVELLVRGQPGPQSEVQDSHNDTETLCQKPIKQKSLQKKRKFSPEKDTA